MYPPSYHLVRGRDFDTFDGRFWFEVVEQLRGAAARCPEVACSKAVAESVGSHMRFDQKWAFGGSEWD